MNWFVAISMLRVHSAVIISFCVAQSAAVARVGVLRCSEAAHSSSSPDPRSLRPPLSYTDQFADRANEPITLTPIGWVRSPYTERFGTPRQPVVETQVLGGGALQRALHGPHDAHEARRVLF